MSRRLTNLDPRHPSAWRKRILEREGRFPGANLTDIAGRIDRLLQFLNEPVKEEWLRGVEDKLWQEENGGLLRLRRGRRSASKEIAHRNGERDVEFRVLGSDADKVKCLDGQLIDGVDAFPLVKDKTIEADMLLLMQHGGGQYRLLLTEVKIDNENAWYAVIENLLQLKLLQAHQQPHELFRRRLRPSLPDKVPLSGLVLAPEGYYCKPRKKAASVEPARALIERLKPLDVDIQLAVWNPANRSITTLHD